MDAYVFVFFSRHFSVFFFRLSTVAKERTSSGRPPDKE